MKRLIDKFFGNNNIVKNMAASGICKPLSMIISYIYVPVVLNYLGVEKYGVWATILTILSWVSYFDIGIGNGLRNRLTETIANKETERSKKLVSSAYAFIAIIMLAVTTIFCIAAMFVNWNRVFGVHNFTENLTSVVSISVIFVAVNFVLSICKNVFYALQKAADVSLMELTTQVINLVGVLIARVIISSNLFAMALIYGFSMIISSLIFSVVLYGKNRDLRPSIRTVDMAEGKSLTSLGLQFFVIQICALVLFTTDSLIISYLYGAADVTPYNTVNKLFNAIIGIYSALIVPVWSAVTKAKVEKNYEEIKKLIIKLQLMMLPFVVGAMILTVLFKPISNLWLGQELEYTAPLIFFGMAYCVLTIWCNTYASIANGLELMKISIITAIVQAVVNIPLSLLFAECLGIKNAGVLAGTVLSMLISAIVQPIAIRNCIKRETRG